MEWCQWDLQTQSARTTGRYMRHHTGRTDTILSPKTEPYLTYCFIDSGSSNGSSRGTLCSIGVSIPRKYLYSPKPHFLHNTSLVLVVTEIYLVPFTSFLCSILMLFKGGNTWIQFWGTLAGRSFALRLVENDLLKKFQFLLHEGALLSSYIRTVLVKSKFSFSLV